MTRRLGAAALLAATFAACVDVLGIRELPLAMDDAGGDGGDGVESGLPDALGPGDVSVDGSPTDGGRAADSPTDAGGADVTTGSAADAFAGDGAPDVVQDAKADRAAGCGSCVGGCCDEATGQCVSGPRTRPAGPAVGRA